MAGLLISEVLARVISVDNLTMGGAESTTMTIVANGRLSLSDVTFGFSGRNRGGGVSGGGSGI